MTTPSPRLDGGHTAGPVEILLDNLNDRQRAFILKMKPHAQSQRMSATDWESVDACIDLGDEFWPSTYWFGGMRLTWVNGRATRTFCFNADGLDVRAAISPPCEGAE